MPPARVASPGPTTPLLAHHIRPADECTPQMRHQPGVVQVTLRRSWTQPWKMEPSASTVNRAGRVPLDIDDVAGVTGRLLGNSPLGPVVTCSLLILGAYFSAASAIGACHLYSDLTHLRTNLRRRTDAIDAHMETASNPTSLQAWRNVCVRDATIATRRQWLQIPCAVGGSLMAVSILCSKHLLGRWSETATVVGAALTWVGAPAMILFTAGTGVESILCARAHGTRHLAQQKALTAGGAEPWATAAVCTEVRGTKLLRAHALTAGSGFLMATGLTLIYVMGAWGLIAMLPGLVGLQFGMRGRQKHTETGDAAGEVARLVHAGSLAGTATRIAEVSAAGVAARDFAANESHVTELPRWIQRLRSEHLFEHWAVELGRDASLRAELGVRRRGSVTFTADTLSAHPVDPALHRAVAVALASTYVGAGVDRLDRIMRVLTDFYIEQLKLERQSPA